MWGLWWREQPAHDEMWKDSRSRGEEPALGAKRSLPPSFFGACKRFKLNCVVQIIIFSGSFIK